MSARSHAPRRDHGFSLIELLVVIAIVALLISILLPALGKTRIAAKQTKALANARTVAQSFELYLGQNKDFYPFVPAQQDPIVPGAGGAILVSWYPQGVFIGETDPFMLRWAWPAVLSATAPWEENYAAWVSPGKDTTLPELPDDTVGIDTEPADQISWRLSNAFLADPRLYSGSAAADNAMLRAVRGSEVAFPSSKVLVWDTHLAYLTKEPELRDGHWDTPTPMAFADGHADARNPLDARDAAANPFHGGQALRLADTKDGARGVDY